MEMNQTAISILFIYSSIILAFINFKSDTTLGESSIRKCAKIM